LGILDFLGPEKKDLVKETFDPLIEYYYVS
jgi:hypothetical protein